MSISRRHALLSAHSHRFVCLRDRRPGAHARDDAGPVQVESGRPVRLRRCVARREGKDREGPRLGRGIQGDAGAVACAPAGRARSEPRAGQGAQPAGHLRQPEGRRGHARGRRAGHARSGHPAWGAGRLGLGILRARGPDDGRGDRGRVDRVNAGAEAVLVLPARHPAPKGAHAERERGSAHGADGADGRRDRLVCEHPAQRGPAVADSHAVRRQAGEARRPGVLGGARVGEPGGSEEGDGRLLHRARQLPQDASAPR